MVKKIVPVVALLAVLGGVYKFVLAKPATAKPKPHVEGIVYLLKKEFLVNLAEGRYAKLTVGLVLAEDDTSHLAEGGEHAATPPEGYGDMAQEGIVRSIITSDLTDKDAEDLTSDTFLLQREATGGPKWLTSTAYLVLATIVAAWLALTCWALRRAQPRGAVLAAA